MQQKGNLKGTYRTLDGMDGDTQTQTWVSDTKKGDKLKLEDGLLATDGWSLIDDSRGLLFDNDPDWDWAKERPANEGQDWYFMAYGHDYKQALKDYTLFAGKIAFLLHSRLPGEGECPLYSFDYQIIVRKPPTVFFITHFHLGGGYFNPCPPCLQFVINLRI